MRKHEREMRDASKRLQKVFGPFVAVFRSAGKFGVLVANDSTYGSGVTLTEGHKTVSEAEYEVLEAKETYVRDQKGIIIQEDSDAR